MPAPPLAAFMYPERAGRVSRVGMSADGSAPPASPAPTMQRRRLLSRELRGDAGLLDAIILADREVGAYIARAHGHLSATGHDVAVPTCARRESPMEAAEMHGWCVKHLVLSGAHGYAAQAYVARCEAELRRARAPSQ